MPLTDTSPAAQQKLRALAPVVLDACPNMQTMAIKAAREILTKHGLPDLDPDHVYWHRFDSGIGDPATFTGWSHNQKPQQSMTLTQLVIHRFEVHDQDNADLLDGDGGFYREGAEARLFDRHNEVQLSASAVLNDFWSIDFSDRYTTRMEKFWSAHFDDFRTLAKVNCLAQALQARQAGHLTEPQLHTVLQALASNLSWPPSLSNLQAKATSADGLRVAALDIGGHIATDILRIIDGDGRQILYVPGESQAFYGFETPPVGSGPTGRHRRCHLEADAAHPRADLSHRPGPGGYPAAGLGGQGPVPPTRPVVCRLGHLGPPPDQSSRPDHRGRCLYLAGAIESDAHAQ